MSAAGRQPSARLTAAVWLAVAGLFSVPVALGTPAPTRQEHAVPLPPHIALALEEKNCKSAAAALEEFLFAQPGHREALFQLSYCYSELGRNQDAINLYGELLSLEPAHFEGRINLGVLLARMEKPAEAAEEFRQAVELRPADFRVRFYYASALEESGRKDEALTEFARAVELRPRDRSARRAAARLIAEKAEEHDAAHSTPVLERLLELVPTDLELLELRAAALRHQKKYEEVLDLYENYFAAAESDPAVSPDEVARIHYQSGLVAHRLGRYQVALKHHSLAEELGGEKFLWASLTGRARALGALERYQEAVPLYRRSIENMGPDVDLKLLAELGFVLFQTRKYAEAIPVLSEITRLDPAQEEPFHQLAFAFHQLENYPAVLKVLDRRAEKHGEVPGTLFLRALAYDHLGQCREAVEYYAKFLGANQGRQNDQFFQASGRQRTLKNTCEKRR